MNYLYELIIKTIFQDKRTQKEIIYKIGKNELVM